MKKRWLAALLLTGMLAGCTGKGGEVSEDENPAVTAQEDREERAGDGIEGGNERLEDDTEGGNESTEEKEVGIRIDFSVIDTQNPPYSKKYDQFTPTWEMGTNQKMYGAAAKQLPQAAALGARNFRVDLFMGLEGGIGGKLGDAADDNGKDEMDYSAIAEISEGLVENGMNPYYVYYANPVYCGGGPLDEQWKLPPDMEKWQELCFQVSSYFADHNIRLGGHEIWNEPDWGTAFFHGEWEEYINTYIYGAKGIREANPDAVVGGLSSAEINKLSANGGVEAFLDAVLKENAALDFISWHYYGRSGKLDGDNPFQAYIMPLREVLDRYPEFDTLQQHLNEFNIFAPGVDPMYRTYQMVPYLFKAMERLNEATDITRVFWASTIGTGKLGCNLINRVNGERYPAYRALWCYARLPQARVKIDILKAPGVKVMAGRNQERTGAILYNTSVVAKQVTVSLEGLMGKNGEMSVYALDEAHPTDLESNSPAVLEILEVSGDMEYSVEIPKNGAVYLEINYPAAAVAENNGMAKKLNVMEKLIRKDYWYPQRGDNCAGAEFDEKTGMGYLWTGFIEDRQGCGIAATLEDMQHEKWTLEAQIYGEARKASEESCLGLKVDYHTKAGYAKSVFYQWKELGNLPKLPWGGRQMDTAVRQSLDGKTEINFWEEAPDGWDGRVMLQWIANDCGKGVYVEFQLYGEMGQAFMNEEDNLD